MTYLVLINNAGVALFEGEPSNYRSAWAHTLDVNVVSVRIISELFLPLLRKAGEPRIVNVSSLRGSFDRVISGRNPPTASIAYSASKACLNMMIVEMANKNEDVTFYAVSPGHCKTAFNGFSGARDPVEGGSCAAELALAEKAKYSSGFWENDNDGLKMEQVGW